MRRSVQCECLRKHNSQCHNLHSNDHLLQLNFAIHQQSTLSRSRNSSDFRSEFFCRKLWIFNWFKFLVPSFPLVQLICSYLFWPLAYIMGIRTVDCFKVAQLIGVKIFLNEFLAYKQLGQLIENQQIVSQFINATLTNSTQAGIFTSDAFNNTFYCSKTALHLITTNATIIGGFISVSWKYLIIFENC